MNNKEAFDNFINEEQCSIIDFNKALVYFKEASTKERERFSGKLNYIVFICLNKIIEAKTADFTVARSLYQNFGLDDDYFKSILDLYIKEFENSKLVKTYLTFANNIYEDLFNHYKKSLWDPKIFTRYAKKYNLSSIEAKDYVSFYVTNVLHFSEKKFKNYRSCFKAFMLFLNNKAISNSAKNNAFKFYVKYANEKEKEMFLNYILDIIKKVVSCINNNGDLDELLKQWHINDYDLLRFIKTLPNIDKNVKIKIGKLFYKYYELAKSENFLFDKIRRAKEKGSLATVEIIELAKFYSINVLNIDKFEVKRTITFTNPKYAILEQLVDENDIDVLINSFLANDFIISEINNFCYCVHKDWDIDKQKEIERKFLTILRKVQVLRKKKRVYSKNYDLYWEYANSPLFLTDFCETKGISRAYFYKKAMDIIKQNQVLDLIKLLKAKIDKEKTVKMAYKASLCKMLLEEIKNGITVNGIKREFTLFDYFIYFGKYDIHKIKINLLPLDDSDKHKLNIFFEPLKSSFPAAKKAFVNSFYEYDSLKDENGLAIRGTGKVLERDDLENILNIFLDNDIPFVDFLVNLATRYYVMGILVENNIARQRK